jgi:cytochrome c oxidase subunit 2
MVVLMTHTHRFAAAVIIVASLGSTSGRSQTPAPAQIVEITAERFSFTPSEVRVKAGAPIEIRLRSEDTNHGFRVAGSDVDVEIPKRGRGVAAVRVQLEPGRYTFECSKLCGAGHPFMHGVLIVTE